jgi:N-acetylmuramoyl-L-alanine amidase
MKVVAVCLLALAPLAAWGSPMLRVTDPETCQSGLFALEARKDASVWLDPRAALQLLGAKADWEMSSGRLLVDAPSGHFVLGRENPYVYIDAKRRLPLPASVEVVEGGPRVSEGSLRKLLEAMGLSQAALQEEKSGEPEAEPTPAKIETSVSKESAPVHPRPHPRSTASRALVLSGVRTIVIDAGHGGFDSGAIGHSRHTFEKDNCLDMAHRLADLLRRFNPRLRIIQTRPRDAFVSLEDRTRIANRAKADLFISIHNNSSEETVSSGTQVFYYDSQSSNKDAAVIARRENANANYLEILLMDLQKSLVRDPSIRLADCVANEVNRTLGLKKRHLQYAPFYVLAKTKMPAILVETAFISNPHEEKLLHSPDFREQMAEAIFAGVKDYGREVLASR